MDDINDEEPLKEGYTRVYEDHTWRWYNDYSPEEYAEAFESVEYKEFLKIVQDEIDKDVISKMLDTYHSKLELNIDMEEETQKYLEHLEKIRLQRERNVPIDIPWVKVKSPEVVYILGDDRKVEPIFTESDGYGRVHIWKEDGIYNAGIEIENRYLDLDDELRPKIRVYDKIPERVLDTMSKL